MECGPKGVGGWVHVPTQGVWVLPSQDPKGFRVGLECGTKGVGAGSLFGPKGVWVWVLCCHEPRGLGDESVARPNRVGV